MQDPLECFVIVVTYGNSWPNVRWASGIKSIPDATALRLAAVRNGFRDAKVWVEKNFRAFLEEKERVRAAAIVADRSSR